MSRLLSALGVLVILFLSMGFASLNSGQRVTLRLGLWTFYAIPLTVVAFGSLVVGMIVMLVAGIRSDLKVRGILRARFVEEDRQEREAFVDLDQRDLFEESRQQGE